MKWSPFVLFGIEDATALKSERLNFLNENRRYLLFFVFYSLSIVSFQWKYVIQNDRERTYSCCFSLNPSQRALLRAYCYEQLSDNWRTTVTEIHCMRVFFFIDAPSRSGVWGICICAYKMMNIRYVSRAYGNAFRLTMFPYSYYICAHRWMNAFKVVHFHYILK